MNTTNSLAARAAEMPERLAGCRRDYAMDTVRAEKILTDAIDIIAEQHARIGELERSLTDLLNVTLDGGTADDHRDVRYAAKVVLAKGAPK